MFVVELRKGVYLRPMEIDAPIETKKLGWAELFDSKAEAEFEASCHKDIRPRSNPRILEVEIKIKEAKEEAKKYQIAVNALKKIASPEVFTQIAKDMKGLAIETLKEISEL